MGYIIDRHIDKWVTEILVSDNEVERSTHVSSGRLTAGMLGKPLQSQILKVKGVPPKEIDPYVLRKFQRGKDVEKWLVSLIPGRKEEQKEIIYRNVVGVVDAIVSTASYEFNAGIIPHEIKSVTNAKFKNIVRSGEADRGHILQACLYALALNTKHFAIDYVASDDYRIQTMVYQTIDYKDEVERIIDRFDNQLASGIIPAFVAEEKWQENKMYADYPDWMDLTEEEVNNKFKEEYEPKESKIA